MRIIQRIKNLYKLSEYKIGDLPPMASTMYGQKILVKDIVTIQKKPATIIKDPENFFDDNPDK